MAELNANLIMKTVIPRVIKATVWGSATFLIIYYIPMMLIPTDFIPIDYATTLFNFTLISVFFVVARQLLSGTIIGCGFGIARALVIIVYFFTLADGGIFSLALPITEVTVNVTFDLSIILLMIVSVNLFDIVKNILEAITILTNKTTEIDVT